MTLVRGESVSTVGRCQPPSGGGMVPATTCAMPADCTTRWMASTDLLSNLKGGWWVTVEHFSLNLLQVKQCVQWKLNVFFFSFFNWWLWHILYAAVCLEEGGPVLHQLSHHHHHPVATKRRGRASLQCLWPLHETPWGERVILLKSYI